ncbi:probable Lysophospholipase [Zygosaccharomyces bailii ISA1307]|nr:probable Lysophospholipase [Zygosaccharomyces bailii ISA1307]
MHIELYAFAVLSYAGVSSAWSPGNSYVPQNVSCASDIQLVREANGVSTNESDWLKKRRPIASKALRSFVERATKNFSDTSLIDKVFGSSDTDAPIVAIGASGGGYRAMLSGAGMVSAFDNRTDGANDHGLGGVLQGTTYLAGLSGGNWLTGTLAWNNWTSVQEIVDNTTADNSIWDISDSIINSGGVDIVSTSERWDHIFTAVDDKHDKFNTSLTDIWGRALSYNFFPSLYRGGVGYTWSTLRDADVFKNAEMPFPITVADGRYPGTKIVNLNSTVFEFNPFEMGSWDPSLRAFTDVKYLGTKASGGKPVSSGECVAGVDNVGFVMGTSSTLFNQFLLRINTTSISSVVKKLITHFLKELSDEEDDIAIYAPNPFYKTDYVYQNSTKGLVNSDDLFLVDGGEDDENIPLVPLLQKERGVDIIFALDNSADTELYWPDGASLTYTYDRQFGKQGKGQLAFPYVPDVETFVDEDVETFVDEGLNQKPVFFGCDADNLTDLAYTPPLVIYVPNAKHSYPSNQSTFKLSYSDKERLGMIRNGFEAATRNNLTDDSNFAGCVACAIMRRRQQSLNATFPKECQQCFSNYCWNGKTSNKATNFTQNNDFSSGAVSSTGVAAASASSVSGSSSASASSGSSSSGTRSSSGDAGTPVFSPRTVLSVMAVVVSAVGLF